MAYTKTTWVDRQVEKPLTFTVPSSIVAGTPFTLTPAEGTIVQAGTPLSATNLNKMENGIEDVDVRLTTAEGDIVTLQSGKLDKTGGTLTGLLTGTTINATTLQEGGSNLSTKYLAKTGGTLTGSLTGTTITGTTINATTNLQEAGVNLSTKYQPKYLTGTTAPATSPTSVGLTYIDTTAKKAYVSTGTASSADWEQIDEVTWTKVLSKPTTIAGYGITDHSWTNLLSKPTTIAGFGITNAYTKTEVDAKFTDATLDGITTIDGGGQVLDLKAGTQDHTYMGFYRDSDAPTTRSGWLGYGSAVSTNMTISNETGNIQLAPSSNNVLIGSLGCYLEAPSNGSIYLHKDADDYLRVASGQQDMYFGGSNSLTFTNGKIKNGAGSMIIEANSSATAPAILSAPMDYVYVQGRDGCRVTAPGTTATFKPIFASAFTVSSERERKTNIVPVPSGALETVMSTTVYDYHLEDELANNANAKKRKGLIVDEAPAEIVHPTLNATTGEADAFGVDLYGMVATLWSAVQELSQQLHEKTTGLDNKKQDKPL